ncbi:MAG: amidophosphoribosyltransferase, partial [Candidatus Aminicenantaceae bacterium]
EVVATLINQEKSFTGGIRRVMDSVEGSCSMLLLTGEGIYAARDKLGRTPIVVGKGEKGMAAALETCAFPNLGFQIDRYLGPGEIGLLTESGYRELKPPEERLQICAFLWVYYGFPASHYENINVEAVRNRCGAALARNETIEIDSVAGIPDSGTGHGLGFAMESHIPFKRPFVKYTPTWPRSFMPHDQKIRDLVATMKLIPIKELIRGKKLLFCEDSIVRGTQLQDTIQRLFAIGAREVHMRPACPPLIYKCKFLNFSRSRSEMDLAARKAVAGLKGAEAAREEDVDLSAYTRSGSPEYEAMVDKIRERLGLTSLRYQRLEDLVDAIGLSKDKLCTYCWDGAE